MTEEVLFNLPKEPVAHRIVEARDVLRALNFDDERSNERSALVLLALLGLSPQQPWATATRPRLLTVDIMESLREQYAKDYKPNTRETIRRFTLHQFIEAHLVERNPDAPGRPVNSPRTCYQLRSEALELLRCFEKPEFDRLLRRYLAEVPGLRERYARAREMNRIPVTLPNGDTVGLSPGGQNILIKQMIEDFCALFTPGGHVLYVGDADRKWAVFEEKALAELGVLFDEHGKMPDLVVYLPDEDWLVLMEAASSHGPVDAKRHGELADLFAAATAGLVYVSCFPTRQDMRRYLSQVAWETEAWCADNPTHLIHFNGKRFLGPYKP